MPVPYASEYLTYLSTYGQGATPGQQSAQTLKKTFQTTNSLDVVLTGAFQTLTLHVENVISSGEKVSLTYSVSGITPATGSSGQLHVQLTVNGTPLQPHDIIESFDVDATGTTVSYTAQVTPAPGGPYTFALQAKVTGDNGMTIQAGMCALYGELVTV